MEIKKAANAAFLDLLELAANGVSHLLKNKSVLGEIGYGRDFSRLVECHPRDLMRLKRQTSSFVGIPRLCPYVDDVALTNCLM